VGTKIGQPELELGNHGAIVNGDRWRRVVKRGCLAVGVHCYGIYFSSHWEVHHTCNFAQEHQYDTCTTEEIILTSDIRVYHR